MAWPWDDEVAAPEQAAAMAPTAPPAALMRAPEGGGMDWRTGLMLAGSALRGGGGTSMLPSILAMQKQQQAQQARGMQASELGRIENSLASAIEEAGGDFGAAITGYRQKLGAEPFQSPEAAQASFRVITGLRDKALQQQKVRATSGLIADALDARDAKEPPAVFAGRLIRAGKDQGLDLTKEATDIWRLEQQGFKTFNNGGIITTVNENLIDPDTQQPVTFTFGEHLQPATAGMPAQSYAPQRGGGFTAKPVIGSRTLAPKAGESILEVTGGEPAAAGAQEQGAAPGAQAPGMSVVYRTPETPALLGTEYGKAAWPFIAKRFNLDSVDALAQLPPPSRRAVEAIWASVAEQMRQSPRLEGDAALTARSLGQQDPRLFYPGEDLQNVQPGAPSDRGISQSGAGAIAAEAQRRREAVAAATGQAGVIAKAAGERSLPLVQVLRSDQHIWDKQARGEADTLNTTMDQVTGQPGRFRAIDTKTRDQVVAIQEMRGLLGEFSDLSQSLATKPGENFGTAAKMWAQTRLGMDNPGVGFEAMRGTVLRLAGAMQGSRVQLSDNDRKAVERMLPSETDSIQTATSRLARVHRILDAMYNAQLGETQGLGAANQLLRSEGGDGGLGRSPAPGAPATGAPPPPARTPALKPAASERRREKWDVDAQGNPVRVP